MMNRKTKVLNPNTKVKANTNTTAHRSDLKDYRDYTHELPWKQDPTAIYPNS